jgi:hypothetical protein
MEAVTFDSKGKISYNVDTGELIIPVIDENGKKFNLKLAKPGADLVLSIGAVRFEDADKDDE